MIEVLCDIRVLKNMNGTNRFQGLYKRIDVVDAKIEEQPGEWRDISVYPFGAWSYAGVEGFKRVVVDEHQADNNAG